MVRSEAVSRRIQNYRRLAERLLPSYMIPSLWVPFDRIPINASGKSDGKRLIALLQQTHVNSLRGFGTAKLENHEPITLSPMEQLLQKIWGNAFNLDPESIGTQDSFFQLGGDSILAIEVVSIARKLHNVPITVQQIFDYTTIADIAHAVGTSKEALPEDSIPPFSLLVLSENDLQHLMKKDIVGNGIDLDAVEDIYPCTPLQEGLIAAGLKSSAGYLAQYRYRIKGPLDIERFKLAWEAVIAKNAILRTVFVFSRC
ncbi:hypothetical protein K493DRAFT_372159 [Basidiobolus meristosporus CBS 931.73]|uniref:Carrier domain-containing protein n=1 Tax=Basidiobolus meristosporus CBS 931.73 TaxID=1314790 RepID=A0A1Y1YCG6_9FUNG|nr:hypothetical protein K493DRAFT_372159 [Basidiobolus meristosporus CBS 931.73]|eukprot:ORX95416.1 hypothetical protein K493DRAFT_372159 [Basidiobolus meristosporus CBS 931.73]